MFKLVCCNIAFLQKSGVARLHRHGRSTNANCGKVWIDGDFWFCVLAAAGAAGAFFLNQAITMAGRKKRRKRHVQKYINNFPSNPSLLGTKYIHHVMVNL